MSTYDKKDQNRRDPKVIAKADAAPAPFVVGGLLLLVIVVVISQAAGGM